MLALIDCNCFYVSCERLFSPSLEGRPVAVLSGPEGCIVSCSSEMKALGAKVGDPWFIAKTLPGMNLAAGLSANFELYGDMSRRVMQTLARFGFPMEVYSIDEAFIELPASMDAAARLSWARKAAADCLSCGIPVSIGIGSTKTRAKLANAWAKPSRLGVGHCDWDGLATEERTRMLDESPCSDVWGVGPKSFEKLSHVGVHSASDLAVADLDMLRKLGTVTLSRCGAELRGQAIHDLVTRPAPAQSIMRTRTFDLPVPLRRDLAAALAHFASAAAFHLRANGLLAGQGEIFISTHPLDRRNPPRSASARFRLETPSDDMLLLCSAAAEALSACFKPGYAYRRAGLVLGAISTSPAFEMRQSLREPKPMSFYVVDDELDALACPSPSHQASMPMLNLAGVTPRKSSAHNRAGLMAAIDSINARHGRDSIKAAAADLPHRRASIPAPTTRLSDVPIARAR